MIDAIGTTLFTYTDSGQLSGEDGPFASDALTSSYWNRMRTNLTLVQPTGTWTNAFSYDSVNRLYAVGSPAGTFTYNYEEPSTRLSGLALPGGAYVFNQFDSMSRLTSTYLYNSGGTPVDGYVYSYDQENQRTNEVRADSSTVDYSYDKIGQLLIADSSVPSEDRGYTYDTAWNLHFRTNNGSLSTFLVDNKNELTNAFATPDAYDSNGNLTGVGAGKVYVYDDENRLVQWFSYQHGASSPTNGDWRTDFAYDGLGRLRVRTEYTLSCMTSNSGGGGGGDSLVGGAQTDTGGGANCNWNVTNEVHYVYDGMRAIQERNASNVPTVSYTRGNDLSISLEGAGGIGGLLSRTKYISGNPLSSALYFSDGNGNVTSLIDTNQSLVASYRYDPFGNIISKSGSLADVNVYRFSSKEVHLNSGMYYYGFRFYDPNLQRWINRDPKQEVGGRNLYTFVNNRVFLQHDPFGEDCKMAAAALARGLKFAGIEEAAGGGPEDPLADFVAGATLAAFAGYATYELFKSPATPTPPANAAGADKAESAKVDSKGLPPGYWPGPAGAAEWGRRNGVDPDRAVDAFHGIKQDDNMSTAKHKYGVNPDTGDVVDPEGNSVGDLNNECSTD